MTSKRYAVGIVLSAVLLHAGCALDYSFLFPPLDVVKSVDIERYTGRWYEIAKYPTSFQANCTDATADYTLQDDGTVRVVNTCQPVDGGELDIIEGYAEVADPNTNAKLTVYFPNAPFGAPYWIIDLGEEYEYAVVGEPSRSFLWILSRTPTMDEELYQEIISRLPEKGYDSDGLESSRSE
jgi:apolipoprotein D and lipocalin family protein